MSRITLQDSVNDMLCKMAEGNPGALTAMINLIEAKEGIDPQSALGPFGPIINLDSWEIYGSSIYVIWADACTRNAHKMIVLLRATQLGIMPVDTLKAISYGAKPGINFKEISDKVCAQLAEFKPLEEASNE